MHFLIDTVIRLLIYWSNHHFNEHLDTRITGNLFCVPFETLLVLLLNFLQVGLQVFVVLFVFGPLILRQDGLGHRKIQSANHAVVSLVVQMFRKATNGFFDFLGFVQAIVMVETYKRCVSSFERQLLTSTYHTCWIQTYYIPIVQVQLQIQAKS